MTLWVFKFAKRKKEQSESEPVGIFRLSRIRSDVDTSMFSLVRDYYIHNNFLQKLSGALRATPQWIVAS